MFIVSLRSSTFKGVLFGVFLVACAVLGVYAAGHSVSVASRSAAVADYRAENAQERIAFLSQFGWEIEEDPMEVSEVLIPSKFDKAFEEYNELQKKHGLDLSKYGGRRAKRWTYEVKNYPGYENSGLIQANLFVYEGRVIGGDICSLETNGFLREFYYPEQERSTEHETTVGQNLGVTGVVQSQ
ncbi:MAG TPA: DUF4830 domain-containing protein [Ruminococcaceae bacterium]|nr:DUF4830 domain-containing protein [Oscillospiraceae bacterium]